MAVLQDLEKRYGPLTISKILKAERFSQKITQAELAKKLKMSKSKLSAIETGRILPSIEFVEKAAKKLKDHPLQWRRILLNQLRREKNKKITIEATASQYLEYLKYSSKQKIS